jgi:hypothetical protein
MSDYLESDFASKDEGLDYLFARLTGIYGAAFSRHWEGLDVDVIRDTWKEVIGRFLTYKPSLDFAVKHGNPDFVPSALAIKQLCEQGPRIPVKPETTLTYTRFFDPAWDVFKRRFIGPPMENGRYQTAVYKPFNE